MEVMLNDVQIDGLWPKVKDRLKREDRGEKEEQQSRIFRIWALMPSGLITRTGHAGLRLLGIVFTVLS